MPVYPYKTRRDKMQSHEQWKSFGKSQEKMGSFENGEAVEVKVIYIYE